jgi:hypothetical protein
MLESVHGMCEQGVRSTMTSSWLTKAREFLLGTPIEAVDPASVHISQVGDEVYNAGAAASSANCGPVAVLMAIRLVGRDVPGAERYRGEELVKYVRLLGTGNTDTRVGTSNLHLQRILEFADCSWHVMRDPRDMLAAVRRGTPVIMRGNPTARLCYTSRYEYYDIRRWDAPHWIVVARFNADRGTYTVNDPQSVIGPVEATAHELLAYASQDGDFGIAVRPTSVARDA